MSAVTRLGSAGYGVRRAGSFDRSVGAMARPGGPFTRVGSAGYGVRRAGTFAGRGSSGNARPGLLFTRLSLDGYGARRAGTFAGRVPVIVPPTGPLRILDVHGAMLQGEFGTPLPAGTPQSSIVSTEPITINAPQYPRLSTNGVSED